MSNKFFNRHLSIRFTVGFIILIIISLISGLIDINDTTQAQEPESISADIQLIYPVKALEDPEEYWEISAGYNTYYHGGNHNNKADLMALDIANSTGDWGQPIFAAADGTVWYRGSCSVVIKHDVHGEVFYTTYLHLEPANLTQDQSVYQGETFLGTIAGCGIASGPHVHFMLNKWNNSEQNPVREMPFGENWQSLPFLNICDDSYPYTGVVNEHRGKKIVPCTIKYKYQYQDQLPPPDHIEPGSTHTVSFSLINKGTETWTADVAKLAPIDPEKSNDSDPARPSPFYQTGAAGWESDSRILLKNGPVPPDGVGVFEAVFTAPSTPGKYRETFDLVAEGQQWFRGQTIWFETFVPDPHSPFPDVFSTDTHYQSIQCLVDHQVVNGYSSGFFGPDDDVLRKHSASMLAKAFKVDPENWIVNSTVFSDIANLPEDEKKFIHLLEHAGVIKGYSDGTFKPDQALNRAEAITLIIRLVEDALNQSIVLPPQTPNISDMQDIIDHYGTHRVNIEKGYAANIVRGYTDGSFRPSKTVSRAEFSSMVVNALIYVYNTEYKPSQDLQPGQNCPPLPKGNLFQRSSNANTATSDFTCFPSEEANGALGCIQLSTNETFVIEDVPADHWAKKEIMDLYDAGITIGCQRSEGRKFCPDGTGASGESAQFINRLEMAIMLLRAKHYYETGEAGTNYSPPTTNPDYFVDISADPNNPNYSEHAHWVNELARLGITKGDTTCRPAGADPNDKYYCPGGSVKGDQIPHFILRTLHGGDYTDNLPPALGIFDDVGPSYHHTAAIEDLYWHGITQGDGSSCGTGFNYCHGLLTRAHAAVMINRAFIRPVPRTDRLGDFCFSVTTGFELDGKDVDDEDIICYHKQANQFKMYFNGSVNGIANIDMDAVSIPNDGEIWFSTTTNEDIPGLGTVRDEDVIVYENQSYRFGLTGVACLDGEDINGYHHIFSHRQYFSNQSGTQCSVVEVEDEDIIFFQPQGNFDMYLDGSDLNLPGDINAFSIMSEGPSNAEIYMSFITDGCIPTANGQLCVDGGDVVRFDGTTGSNTTGSFSPHVCFDTQIFNATTTNSVNALHVTTSLDCGPTILPEVPKILSANPTQLNFTAQVGGDNPPPQSIFISTEDTNTLGWVAQEDIPWLNLSRLAGATPSAVNAWVDIADLTEGVYTGQIRIAPDGGNGPHQVIYVRLIVEEAVSSTPIYLTAEAGLNSVQLDWAPPSDPSVSHYMLYRSFGNESQMSYLNTTNDPNYVDLDTLLLPGGSKHCYRVDAMRVDGTLAAGSNTACVIIGQTQLWVPDVTAALGQTAKIPINISNANGLRIAASDIHLDFDPSVIQVTGVASTPLSAQYQFNYGILSSTGPYSEARISTTSVISPPQLYDEGALFELLVEVVGTEGVTTPLNLKEFIGGVGGSTIYTPDNLFQSIPLKLQDGSLTVSLSYILGDVNGNGVVEAADAFLILQIASGQYPDWDERMQQAGDVNGDGVLDHEDATMILYYAANNQWPPAPSANIARSAQQNPILLDIADVSGQAGQLVSTTLQATNLSDWAGGSFTIVYDPALLDGTMIVTPTDLAEGFALAHTDYGDGMLRISMANATPVSGDGDLVTLTFQLSEDALGNTYTFALADAVLSDGSGRDFVQSVLQLVVERDNGEVVVSNGTVNLPPNIPSNPNPADGFNNAPITQTLSWLGGDPDGDVVTYTIAFGDSNPPSVVATTTALTYSPALTLNTTYYWQITATDGISKSVGPVWSFTTKGQIDKMIYLPLVIK